MNDRIEPIKGDSLHVPAGTSSQVQVAGKRRSQVDSPESRAFCTILRFAAFEFISREIESEIMTELSIS